MKRILVFILTILSTTVIADDIVINATKIDKSASTITQSVSVITEDQIKEQGFTNVTEVLRQNAGIEFKKVNGPGHYAYIKMRGFSTGHILLVVDGVTITSEGAPDGIGAIINQMDSDSIEKIEILRGPQATLYGANSTAGVISITTKSGKNAKPELSIGFEAGSLDWKKTKASFRDSHKVGDGNFNYSVNLSKVSSDGIVEDEFYEDTSDQLKLGYTLNSIETGLSFWQTDNKFGYAELIEPYDERTRQNIYGFQFPDPNQYSATKSRFISGHFKHKINEKFNQNIQISTTESERKSEDLPDGTLGSIIVPEDGFALGGNQGDILKIEDGSIVSHSKFEEKSQKINYNLLYQNESFSGIIGLEDHQTEADNQASYLIEPVEGELDYRSAFLNGEYSIGQSGATLAAGLRHDNYDGWKNKTVGSIGINYNMGPASVFGNFGTSYKVPTLNQTKGTYGSDTLTPESGKTLETGFRQQIMQGRLIWDATLWRTQLDDVIFFDNTILNALSWNGLGKYNNGSKQRTQGLELNLAFSITPELTLQSNYTYTDSHMKAKGSRDWERTVQIARNKGNVGLFYSVEKISTAINVYYSGPRLRWKGDVEMESYVRVDVSANYNLSDKLAIYTRIENLLNEEIEEGLGYQPLGVYAITGISYNFF